MNAPFSAPTAPQRQPADPEFAARCRASFGRQEAMALIGARRAAIEPGRGARLVARGEGLKPGRTLSVARAEVYAESGGGERLCAAMRQTPMMLPDTDTPE